MNDMLVESYLFHYMNGNNWNGELCNDSTQYRSSWMQDWMTKVEYIFLI